uniref:F-box protein At3g59000 n=1 Tax=Cajanus cajan TaxID=3821 RepID=A0A151UCQ6_CAJCA|nr:F-box protein At3g59000 [Cajanus cajan]
MMIERKSEEDKISALPDDVLCLILSFLTLKEAIATSLLSTRWRFVWTMLPSLHIGCAKPIMKHYKSVNVFLALRRTEKITSFQLKCNSDHDCCSNYVEEWISKVVARKVEQVHISLCRRSQDFNTRGPRINSKVIPHSRPYQKFLNWAPLFHCTTIATLKLERFYLRYYLKEFTIVRNSRYTRCIDRNHLYDIVMQCDYDFISNYMKIRGWRNIKKTKVYITMYHDMKETVSEILQRVCSVEFLSLKYCRDDINPFPLDLPLFKNLVELRLFLKKDDSLIKELPAKCPNLQVLEVTNLDDRERCRYNFIGGARVHDLSIVPI